MTKSASIGVRVSPELKAWLQQLAEANNRSVSNIIEQILNEYKQRD